jgi:hypothetical protein
MSKLSSTIILLWLFVKQAQMGEKVKQLITDLDTDPGLLDPCSFLWGVTKAQENISHRMIATT